MEKDKHLHLFNNLMSQSLIVCIFLAISGGGMDAYSYLLRDKVFANAQTGNVIFFAASLIYGEWAKVLKYFLPIAAFILGIVIADIFGLNLRKNKGPFHWRHIIIVLEAILLTSVVFIPDGYSEIANPLISLACGMQVQSFMKVEGNQVATTMCIGNLRSGTHNICLFFKTKESQYLKSAGYCFSVILAFMVGAIIESELAKVGGHYSLFFCVALLALTFLFMSVAPVIKEKKEEKK